MLSALRLKSTLLEATAVVAVGLGLAGALALTHGVPERSPAEAACGAPEQEIVNPVLWTTLEAARGLHDNHVVFVDVRAPELFAAGHVTGALSSPVRGDAVDEAAIARLGLGAGHTVLVYDDSEGSCDQAMTLAQALADRGHDARVLEPGFGAWLEAGYPAEAGMPLSPALSSPALPASTEPEEAP